MAHRRLIYHPSGRAGEYVNKGYAANLFKGCTHGCKYCYVPQFTHQSREDFHTSCMSAPNVLERLKQDMKRVGILPEPIFLCFTCDPYCIDGPEGITRKAIEIILESGNRVNILTKGGTRACKDFDLLSSVPGNKIGSTLTFYTDILSVFWEPRAELASDRVKMLKRAWLNSIETWASIEPVINPIQSMRIIKAALPYVDEFKIGKWNHDQRANAIDWQGFTMKVRDLMEKHGKQYTFKVELREIAKSTEREILL